MRCSGQSHVKTGAPNTKRMCLKNARRHRNETLVEGTKYSAGVTSKKMLDCNCCELFKNTVTGNHLLVDPYHVTDSSRVRLKPGPVTQPEQRNDCDLCQKPISRI